VLVPAGADSHLHPATGADGKISKAKYTLPDGLAEKIRARAADLLSGFPLYPTIDLG